MPGRLVLSTDANRVRRKPKSMRSGKGRRANLLRWQQRNRLLPSLPPGRAGSMRERVSLRGQAPSLLPWPILRADIARVRRDWHDTATYQLIDRR